LVLVVAGLLLVTLAFVTPQPKGGAPSVSVETGAAQPEVEGVRPDHRGEGLAHLL
jgi:hypothetical protein